jgi:hypothetical protein
MAKTSRAHVEKSLPTASVCIYINENFVTELLQQMVELGLLQTAETEQTHGESDSRDTALKGNAAVKGDVDVPAVATAGASAGLGAERQRSRGQSDSRVIRQQFAYSQSYYLHVIRQRLRAEGDLKVIAPGTDATELAPGDFVEFSATFRANEINAILDIASPDLVGAIVEHSVRTDALRTFDVDMTFDERKNAVEKIYAKASDRSRLAKTIVNAVRDDFRSADTREYYGNVDYQEGLTAITICEAENFLVQDHDRILDGTFTVLGKVCSHIQEDTSLFDRNKLLYRMNVDMLDAAFKKLEAAAEESFENPFTEDIQGDLFDVGLTARLAGRSFKLLPIAIYV